MIVVPTSQALVAGFAPEKMRGRYMAIAGLSWAIPSTIGPGAAGYILDNYNPNLLWYIGGALCGVSVLAYYSLHLRLGDETGICSRERRDNAPPGHNRLTNSPAFRRDCFFCDDSCGGLVMMPAILVDVPMLQLFGGWLA